MLNDKLAIQIVESEQFKKDIKKLGKRYRLVREDIKPLIEQYELELDRQESEELKE